MDLNDRVAPFWEFPFCDSNYILSVFGTAYVKLAAVYLPASFYHETQSVLKEGKESMAPILRLLIAITALGVLPGCVDPPKSPYVNTHDLITRIDELRAPAEQGTPEDQYRLGAKYESLSLDYREAVHWYRMAAIQRQPDAIYRLCVLSASGRGLPQDYQEAWRWCRLAADHGHARAMFAIGTFYEAGRGVPKDPVQAHQWYNLAAATGLEAGAKRRDRLALDMSVTQITQAQLQARNWKAKYDNSHE